MKVVELLAQGIKWWSCDGSERWSCDDGERARRSDDKGAVALCFALLRCGRERAGCEGEMERAAEVRALSLHAGLTDRASTGVRPPHGLPGLPPVSH